MQDQQCVVVNSDELELEVPGLGRLPLHVVAFWLWGPNRSGAAATTVMLVCAPWLIIIAFQTLHKHDHCQFGMPDTGEPAKRYTCINPLHYCWSRAATVCVCSRSHADETIDPVADTVSDPRSLEPLAKSIPRPPHVAVTHHDVVAVPTQGRGRRQKSREQPAKRPGRPRVAACSEPVAVTHHIDEMRKAFAPTPRSSSGAPATFNAPQAPRAQRVEVKPRATYAESGSATRQPTLREFTADVTAVGQGAESALVPGTVVLDSGRVTYNAAMMARLVELSDLVLAVPTGEFVSVIGYQDRYLFAIQCGNVDLVTPYACIWQCTC